MNMNHKFLTYNSAFIVLLTLLLPRTAFSSDAESELVQYLNDREKGNFSTCGSYFTKDYKIKFLELQGRDCYQYLRSNELDYKSFEIIKKTKNRASQFTVKITFEDPTSISISGSATELYTMVTVGADWKINDWSIEYH